MKRSVAAVIILDGRVLVARRPFGGPLGLLWEFPGGKVEEGESDEQALVREFDEEFAAGLTPLASLGSTTFMHHGSDRFLSAWRCALSGGSALDPREHVECRWVGAAELAALSLADSDAQLMPLVVPLLVD